MGVVRVIMGGGVGGGWVVRVTMCGGGRWVGWGG